MDNAVKHEGGCLCGGVRFEVYGGFEGFFLCHCSHCRKGTGSAHAANIFSHVAKLRWLSGESQVTVYNLPETRHVRSFCTVCGSALPTLQMNGRLLVVPAGSLDTDVPLRPQGHIFMESRANWDEQLEKLPQFGSFPE
ncbi:GFA family protein [Algiphilus sp.]|uniref:GFA family protein n=1 Tax=Algiphilus sp. TaxID=1872431 RepID=UPI003BA8EED3